MCSGGFFRSISKKEVVWQIPDPVIVLLITGAGAKLKRLIWYRR